MLTLLKWRKFGIFMETGRSTNIFLKLFLYCLEWLLAIFPLLRHHTDSEIANVSGRNTDKSQSWVSGQELSIWVFLSVSFSVRIFFFFQRENETEKRLCAWGSFTAIWDAWYLGWAFEASMTEKCLGCGH